MKPMKPMTTIDPTAEFGDFLKTRFLGERLRSGMVAALEDGGEVRIDFSRVSGMAHSFADECFGDLFSEFGADLFRGKVHLSGMNPEVKSVLRLVFADRKSRLPT